MSFSSKFEDLLSKTRSSSNKEREHVERERNTNNKKFLLNNNSHSSTEVSRAENQRETSNKKICIEKLNVMSQIWVSHIWVTHIWDHKNVKVLVL